MGKTDEEVIEETYRKITKNPERTHQKRLGNPTENQRKTHQNDKEPSFEKPIENSTKNDEPFELTTEK
ncbi:hypothetical protein C2G38_2157771 [Gigaspora rosea]|uniref:Uncharacterized protein n=1 Tax=Gigaspora rosea TaxID=44941 RepID=A0A397W4I7_9GLOM|nr:hypothetical protein C2G38_2157771 [Gigaspora rosea]